MTPRHPPILGPAIARNCTRWLGDHNCGKPAVRHVIWDEELENGFVCEDHLAELGTVWSFLAAHAVGPDCAMPGSLFFLEENACRCPDELPAPPDRQSETLETPLVATKALARSPLSPVSGIAPKPINACSKAGS